VFVYNSKK
jgi:hypothetical protein